MTNRAPPRSRPARARGQNLLIDSNVARRVVEAAALPPDATVLEIGAGTGMLTRELAAVARTVVAVEIEYSLAQRLRISMSRLTNVNVIRADARKINIRDLLDGAKYHVVSNLPYSVGTPLTIDLLQSDYRPQTLTIMLQLEVARRICAEPGDMSVLSVIAQSFSEPRFAFEVAPESFKPKPKVRSGVIRLTTNSVSRDDIVTNTSIHLARHAFAGRRKKMQNSIAAGLRLSPAEAADLCTAAGIDPGLRPQEIPLSLWRNLAEVALAEGIFGQAAQSPADAPG